MPTRFRSPISPIWALLFATALGCAHEPLGGGIRFPEKVAFAAADGEVAFRLQPAPAGVRVENAAGQALAVLRLASEGLEIEDAQGRAVAVVLPPAGEHRGYRIVRAGSRAELYVFRGESDGDYKLLGPDGKVLYRAKRRDYGFKLVDAEGNLESKIRVREQKTSVRNAEGTTFLSTRDRLPREAMAALMLEGLRFEYAAGLAVALAHWPPPDPSQAAP